MLVYKWFRVGVNEEVTTPFNQRTKTINEIVELLKMISRFLFVQIFLISYVF